MKKAVIRKMKASPTARKKAWVRESALRLLEAEPAGSIGETGDERSRYAHAAIDQAERLWNQAEGKFLLPPKGDADD